MDNTLILKRTLAIETWQFLGTVAKKQEQSYLMPVLLCLRDFPGMTAKETAKHLFNDDNTRTQIPKRILNILNVYGLVETEKDSDTLTEEGRKAAESEEMFIPEDGTWQISVSDDSLLPHPVIKLETHLEPSAFTNVKDQNSKQKIEPTKIPEWVKEKSTDKELMPHKGGEVQRIERIEGKGTIVEEPHSLSIEWNVGEDRIRILDGVNEINQFNASEVFRAKITVEAVWKCLLNSVDRLEDWDEDNEKVAMTFEELDDTSRKTMFYDFSFEKPEIRLEGNDYGTFEDSVVKGIPIGAKTQEDAQEWAQWRLDHSVNQLATQKKYTSWTIEAEKPFSDFDIELPTRDEAAKKRITAFTKDKGFTNNDWKVVAAADWNL